jgi:myosin heavy subunit
MMLGISYNLLNFTSYEQGRLLAGVLYIHRITDKRVGGLARRNFAVFRRLCGETTLKNTMVVTNMWTPNASEAVAAEEEDRERELATNERFFKRALENGARIVRHHNTVHSAHSIIRHFLKNKPQPLLIQRELVDENKNLIETDIGSYFKEEMKNLSKRHAKEIEELKKQGTQQMEEINLNNARLLETIKSAKEQDGSETAALRELVSHLLKELKETREALKEEREKVQRLEQQMQLLMSSSNELRTHVENTVKAVNEIRKDTNRRRMNTERAEVDEKPLRERRSAPLPSIPTRFPQPVEEEKEAWCVVQ